MKVNIVYGKATEGPYKGRLWATISPCAKRQQGFHFVTELFKTRAALNSEIEGFLKYKGAEIKEA